ncbi:MAG: 50S ribosomal protein L32 [Halobacteriovoraceae bacterium]|nr:50S ribosomal protein L32 [Halobacteriovoraceae bacterium]MCB9094174.1 50S ribosomal protein L32 [Halobacteriovoraceae bacterium]
MAVPKKRTSVSRKGLRRAGQHHKMYRKHATSCKNCGALVLPHNACPSCGYYKGKEIFTIKVKEAEEEEQE